MRHFICTSRLVLAIAVLFASAAGLAQATQDPPTTSPDQQLANQADVTDDPAGLDQQSRETGENSASRAQTSPSAAVIGIARWLRTIGGRVSLGPKINHTTRVSLPRPTDPRQGWRVSTPSFAHARLVPPPSRAQPANTAPSNESTQTDAVELVAEPATNE